MNTSQPHEGAETIDRAMEWIERLREGESQSEAFFDWLTESPRHVEVFMQAMTLQQRVASIAPEQWTALGTTGKAAGLLEPDNVVELTALPAMPARSVGKRRRRIAAAAIAASAAAVAVGGWALLGAPEDGHDYLTAIGEQRAVQLEDGSVVNLNTSSHLKVLISAHARELQLLEGEALFKVQHDSTRPFRVRTRDTLIQVLGTQFNVHQSDKGTTVSVLEGRVQVQPETGRGTVMTPAALSTGEAANIGRDGRVEKSTAARPAHVTAWQQRRLIFDEETLANIVLEFNRYNRRQLRIEDEGAGTRRFSGIFDADDPESLAQLLAREGRLEIGRGDDEIVIRAR